MTQAPEVPGARSTASASERWRAGRVAAPRTLRERLLAPPALGPLSVGLVFFLESLRPSLLPRPVSAQGVISAICLLVGYGIGAVLIPAGIWLAKKTTKRRPSERWRRSARGVLLVAWVLSLTLAMVQWRAWQNQQRRLDTMSPLDWWSIFTTLVITLVFATFLLATARLVDAFVSWCSRLLQRRLSRRVANAVVAVVVVLFGFALVSRAVYDGARNFTDSMYQRIDSSTESGITQPSEPEVSGSPSSLIAWSTLGFRGRTWVATATTPQRLARFAGSGVAVYSPIRIYAGLDSAANDQARATIALDDLIRAGGFHRKVLMVVTATGTGWVNPVMSAALEYEWAGDTAIVSMQYSYLPSWISFITDRGKAATAGRVLNQTIWNYWHTLPAASRPRLIIYGESLGSYGAEFAWPGSSAQSAATNLLTHSDGALLVGPTNENPSWNQFTDARENASPVWHPVVPAATSSHGVVTFSNNVGDLAALTPARRVSYLEHPSDPVTWWSWQTFWSEPDWQSADPRGYDLPQGISWFPIVTWVQATSDLIQAFSALAGHGHNYNDAWPQAIASVAPPPGWTSADADALSAELTTAFGRGNNY